MIRLSLGDEMGDKLVCISFKAGKDITKFGVKNFLKLLLKGVKLMKNKVKPPSKKMRLDKLEKNGDTVIGVEVSKKEMEGFGSHAKAYNLDYTLIRHNDDATKYDFFFKEKDLSKLERCLEDFCKNKTKDVDRSTLKERMMQAQERATRMNKEKAKEKTQSKGKSKEKNQSKAKTKGAER